MMDRSKGYYESYNLDYINKEELLNDPDLAIGLATYNLYFRESEFVDDPDILKLNYDGVSVRKVLELGFFDDRVDLLEAKSYKNYSLEGIKKEDLLEDTNLAVGLARYNVDFGTHPLAQEIEILELRNGLVARELAWSSYRNGWAKTDVAQNLEVLKLSMEHVAEGLAYYSDKNGWIKTNAPYEKEVLRLCWGNVKKFIIQATERSSRKLSKNILEEKKVRIRGAVTFKENPDFYKKYDLDSLKVDDLLNDVDLVEGLVFWNKDFGQHPLAQDINILKLNEGNVAWLLANRSNDNGWGRTDAAQNFEVLKLADGYVAMWLATNSKWNGWAETEAVKREEVRGLVKGEVGELIDGVNKKINSGIEMSVS